LVVNMSSLLGSVDAVVAPVTQETTGPIAKRLLAIGGGLPAWLTAKKHPAQRSD
jgi:hypothetical protein